MRKHLSLAAVLLLASLSQAQGQIEPTSPARQRAANRQALREAQRAEVPYKESHLDVQPQHLKRGSSEVPRAVAGEPRFSRDGTPHVTTRKFPGLRRKRKNEPTP